MTHSTLSNPVRSRLFQDLLFWTVSFFILLTLFTRTGQTRTIDYIYTLLFHLPLVAAVSINSYLLFPRLLSKGRFVQYLGSLLPLYGLTWGIYSVTFNHLSDWIFPGYYFIVGYSAADILLFFTIYILLTTLLEFSKSWFREMEMARKVESLQKENVESELKALRSQINPHFLFNSLNHIYALATQNRPETGEAVLELSELLRYALKQSESGEASLQDEIDYIHRYIALYKRRIHHPERVEFTTEGDFNGAAIAPLLLIFFVENCFKHGTIDRKDEKISIKITKQNRQLRLVTSNNTDNSRKLPEESEGMGLENVRRRLELLYPGGHRLDLSAENGTFEVELELELS